MVTAERERQIRENLGLVHTVANRFRGRGIEYDDLFQSGCVGLIKAVDRFDPTLGYAFSTYAVPVIIGEIKRLFRDGGAVKVSRVLKEKALHATRLQDGFFFTGDLYLGQAQNFRRFALGQALIIAQLH